MSTAPFCPPVTLAGRHAALEPLSQEHHDGLCAAVRDGELWTLWYTNIPHPDGMRTDIESRLALKAAGSMQPFAVRNPATGRVAGMTTYLHIDPPRRRLEIGATWYAQSVQRTALNTECKLLLLTHAFETLKCIAVEFRTSYYNHSSRAAIARLGAKQDGLLRNHGFHANGTIRDTVVFSNTDAEWPGVKAHLAHRLAHRPAP
jgi:RimJ/RimL family protein N-acetyltransferase